MTTTKSSKNTKSADGADYGASSITVLEGLEAVRKRPGMYIGGTASRGLHHLIWEVVDNAVDEAMAGYATKVVVRLGKDGSVEVTDNGRGIPVEIHPQTKKSTLTTVLTVLHAGGKFGGGGYKVSGGLHGVGVSVVNALSAKLEAEVLNGGHRWTQSFRRGVPETPDPKKGAKAKGTGTTIRFWPDGEIFETLEFERDVVVRRIRQMAYLNPGLAIRVIDERDPDDLYDEEFSYEGGVADFVTSMASTHSTLLKKPLVFSGKVDANGGTEIEVDVAINWTTGYSEDIRSFVNTVATGDGGTHEEGFFRAVTRVMNQVARDIKVLKPKDANLRGDDLREGMVAVISIRMPEPQFEGQTKGKLGSSSARGAVESVVSEGLAVWAAKRRSDAKRILTKAAAAQKAREAARAVREATRKQALSESSTLPGKLADCRSRNVEHTELLIAEGDSAMGTGKQARDAEFQALLPIRGKILNTFEVSPKKLLENKECSAIITALGAGFGSDFDTKNLRYGRVVILTDADTDGAHIRILLLTLFWKYMRPLLEEGRVYAAQPPLYKIRLGKDEEPLYAYSDAERDEILAELKKKGKTPRGISRYKGLGEMPADELAKTVMDPETRVLRRVTIEDAAEAAELFATFMGSDSSARKEYIALHADGVANIDA